VTLFVAMILDAAFGEPRLIWSRWPHPAVLMGRLIDWADTNFNTGRNRKLKGCAVMGVFGVGALVAGKAIALLPTDIADIVVLAILLAQRSLSDHVLAVARALRQSLPEGRTAVAQIVGRDTATMDAPAVARSAMESAAENLSDGVIAPIFWFAAFGLPGLLLYKVANTADSMIGHLTPRHAEFGWAAARFDDLLNLIPARLTAAIMLIVTARFDMARRVQADAPQHRSPNAGWPEAAMAHVLNVALSGPRSYGGQMRDDPFINPGGIRDLGPDSIIEAVWLIWKVWAVVLATSGIVALS
jgi:adenosylcobinamide-phosphate synthase